MTFSNQKVQAQIRIPCTQYQQSAYSVNGRLLQSDTSVTSINLLPLQQAGQSRDSVFLRDQLAPVAILHAFEYSTKSHD